MAVNGQAFANVAEMKKCVDAVADGVLEIEVRGMYRPLLYA